MILLFAVFSRVKIIVHSHNIESMRFRSLRKWWWPVLWCYEWLAYKCADQVWFITQSDKDYAVKVKAVSDQHSVVVPHGTELSELPLSETRQQAKQFLIDRYGISTNDKIILFNGALGYAPNLEALRHILDDINPLLQQIPISYKIMICGSGLPADMDGLKAYAEKNIIFAGFVDSISPFLLGADLFLNPMCNGGGMQTKLIEALGYGLTCVSSVTGSTGIEQAYTDGRLRIVPDQNWQEYCNAILELPATLLQTEKQMFYQYYSWNQIAKRTLNFLIH
jgi:glycosyltransferase involved in cell wall biosynthesis